MKSMSEILAEDELYFTDAYIDLHIWSICILGSQTCYPGREEIASTLACASFVGLVEALPAWRSRGIFCFLPEFQVCKQQECWVGSWPLLNPNDRGLLDISTTTLPVPHSMPQDFLRVVSFLLVVSFARCLVRRRGTIKFHDWSVLFDSNDMFPFVFTSLDGQQKDHLNHNGQFASLCFLQLMHGMVST